MYCPSCGGPVDEGNKFCKHCGNAIMNPTIGTEHRKTARDTSSISSYEAPKLLPEDMLKDGERIVFEVHPHKVFTLLGSWILGIFLAIFGLALLAGTVVGGIAVLVLDVVIVVGAYLRWQYTIYALTTERVIRLKGIIGKDLYENRLAKIQDLRLKMGVLQRLFGCGDVMLTTAGTAFIECAWKNIGNPRQMQGLLRRLLGGDDDGLS